MHPIWAAHPRTHLSTEYPPGGFEKWEKKKKKKKRSSPHFVTFPPSLLQFSFFSSQFHTFSFFPCLFFPGRSAEISRSEVGGGHSARLLRHWVP